MAAVDLLDGHTEVNWPVPLILGALTLFVAVMVIVSHTRGRKHAVDVARHVFVRSGALARPRVSCGLVFRFIFFCKNIFGACMYAAVSFIVESNVCSSATDALEMFYPFFVYRFWVQNNRRRL